MCVIRGTIAARSFEVSRSAVLAVKKRANSWAII